MSARPYDEPMFEVSAAETRTPRGGRRRVARSAPPRPETPTSASLVLEFHRAFGLPLAEMPTVDVEDALLALRNRLLLEESAELVRATEARDLLGIADGIADVLYVVYGTAVTFGLDADALVREVHRSNMSKLDLDGRPILRADGKVLKGPSYEPPRLGPIIGLGATD